MRDHREIRTLKQVYKEYPLPWRVRVEDNDCYGIVAANSRQVVETDSGFYPPGRITAELIVAAVNGYRHETI